MGYWLDTLDEAIHIMKTRVRISGTEAYVEARNNLTHGRALLKKTVLQKGQCRRCGGDMHINAFACLHCYHIDDEKRQAFNKRMEIRR